MYVESTEKYKVTDAPELGNVLNRTQRSIVKSLEPNAQSAESGIERYWLELATNLPLAPPNLFCEVSTDAPPFDVIAFGAIV